MELMQIIESSVSLFSFGLMVFIILSYVLFKVKNRSIKLPSKRLYNTEVSIIYEQPAEIIKEEPVKNDISKRFIVLNDSADQSETENAGIKKRLTSNRFYVYKPVLFKTAKEFEYYK